MPGSKEMTLLEHIEELRNRVVRSFIVVIAITVFSFVFGFKPVTLGEYSLYLPFPDPLDNVAIQLIRKIQVDQVPPSVTLIQIAPGQAFFAQIYVAIFLGIVVGMPFIVREISAFVNPALYPHERKAITKLVLPATVLFILGAVFSYLLVTPFAINFLYTYGAVIPAVTFITIMDLITFVLQFTIAFGLAFQLPIIMWLLTKAGLVSPQFWKNNLRYAAVIIVIFGAVITPDGSGITMWFVALPMLALYALGYIAVR